MPGDKAHQQLLAAGWIWAEASQYEQRHHGIALSPVSLAHVSDDMPTEERLLEQRRGPWLLPAGARNAAAYDSLPFAATSVILGAAYSPV